MRAESYQEAVQRLFREMYHPFEEAAELARCFGEAALAVTEAPLAEIVVRSLAGTTSLQASYGEGEGWKNLSFQSSLFPVCYQATEMGRLRIALPARRLGHVQGKACEWIARALAYHLQRHEIRQLARDRYGREVSLIGTSDPLGRVDRFLERASQTTLPALILGGPGSEVERIGLALHLMGPTREGPFLQTHCATLESASFERQLLGLLENADEGTLLLARLEQLDLRSQHLLWQMLETGLASWAAGQGGQPVTVRLIATAAPDLDERSQRGGFCAGLCEQLDFLRLEVEPLRNRREDIRPLIEHHLRRHARGSMPEISEEALQACVEYEWPGDISELARLVARLAVMSGEERILPRHLHAYAPQILEARAPRRAADTPPRPAARPQPSGKIDGCHPSLQRAIDFIAAHPQERLSLSAVAASAFVSSSHLAHLFQQDLGTTFIRFLTSLRLERAKQLLRSQPREAITNIALEAGFSDLRHFERTFKGAVGCTPKEFRRLSTAAAGFGRRAEAPQDAAQIAPHRSQDPPQTEQPPPRPAA